MKLVSPKKYTINLSELIYLLYFSIMTAAKGLGLYDGMFPYTLSLYISAFLIIIKLFLTEYTISEWIYVLSMIILGIFIFHNSDQTGALIYISMIVTMKKVPLKRILTIGLTIWLSTFLLLILLSITGISPGIFVIHEKLGLGYVIRWALGQPHPNVLQITSLMICSMILYLTSLKGKKLLYVTFIMLVANLYIFFYSISYTGLILVLFYLSINLYFSFKKRLYKLEILLINLVFPLCIAFSILGPIYFPENLWNLCNKILNTRFNIAKQHLTLDRITLFGARPSAAIPQQLHNIDSSYVFALMRYGIILFVLMCIAYLAYIYHCTKKKKYKEMTIVLAFCVAAIAEPFFVNPSFKNITLLFVGDFIFHQFEIFSYKKPNILLNKKICFIPLGKTEIIVSLEPLSNLLSYYFFCLKKNFYKLLVIGLCSSILSAALFTFIIDIPSRYYALRSSTHYKTEEYILLDINNLPEDFDGKILNYIDDETPMMMFEGNICKIEYARGIVSSFIWGGLITSFFFSIIFMRKKYKT